MPYISKKQLAELRKIAGTATMSHASFGFNEQEGFVAALETFGTPTQTTPDEYIKARTRIWRESWIIDPLNAICDAIEGKA